MTKDENVKLTQLFGVDEETVKESIDIRPTFPLGDLEIGKSVRLTVLSADPKEIEIEDKFDKGKKKKTKIIYVLDEVTGIEYTLWLSSKSLALGFAKLYYRDNTLENTRVKVSVSLVDFKDYGENRCYDVQKITEPKQTELED